MTGIFGTAFLRTSTPGKAINGFRDCGLWPFDDTIFQANEFAAAAVTEEGPPIHDTTEQADMAAVDVHAIDVPVVVDHQDPLQDHPAVRAVLLRRRASPLS